MSETTKQVASVIPIRRNGTAIEREALPEWPGRHEHIASLTDDSEGLDDWKEIGNRIVLSYNSHAALVEACEASICEVECQVKRDRNEWPDTYEDGTAYTTLCKLRTALALAKGGRP